MPHILSLGGRGVYDRGGFCEIALDQPIEMAVRLSLIILPFPSALLLIGMAIAVVRACQAIISDRSSFGRAFFL
jgi:hypothetical protein